jgi:hypothetical protein
MLVSHDREFKSPAQRTQRISVLDLSSKPRHSRQEGAANRHHSPSRSRTRLRIHRGQIQICRSVGRQIRGQGGRTRHQNGQCHRGPPEIRDLRGHLRQSHEPPRQNCHRQARTLPWYLTSSLPSRRKSCRKRDHRLAHGISPRFGADAGSKDEIAVRRHLFPGGESCSILLFVLPLSATAGHFCRVRRELSMRTQGGALFCSPEIKIFKGNKQRMRTISFVMEALLVP